MCCAITVDRETAIAISQTGSGDVYNWIDFKEDYTVTTNGHTKAEFIKDIAALANTSTEKDAHYIVIGVNDDGDLVGVSNDWAESPDHILTLDDADIQTILTEYLDPTPQTSLTTFTGEEPNLGVLEVIPLSRRPCVVDKNIKESGSIILQKGLIFLRHGSRNTIARRSEIEQIIDERVSQRRDEILDSIKTTVELGPERVAHLADNIEKGDDEEDLTVSIGEDSDIKVEERITRTPASDLDEELNQDISQWAKRDVIELEAESVWKYYESSDELHIDTEAAIFLTRAAIQYYALGIYWLDYVGSDNIRDILVFDPGDDHESRRIAMALASLGEQESLEEFFDLIKVSSSEAQWGEIHTDCQKSENPRLNALIDSPVHDLSYSKWNETVNVKELSVSEIRGKIPEVAGHALHLKQRSSGYDTWYTKYQNHRNCIRDMEVALGVRGF